MDYKALLKKPCRKLSHGMVLESDYCQRECKYLCFRPYKHADTVRIVNCEVTSGEWLTISGKTPCIKSEIVSTTRKYVNFDSNLPRKYDDIFNMNDIRTIPTYKPIDFDIPDMQVPTVQTYNFNDDYTESSTSDYNPSSATIPGLVVAGVFVLMIISVFMRLWGVRLKGRRRRRESIQQLVEEMTSENGNRAAREECLPVTPPQSRQEDAQTPTETDDSGVFIIIRRIFRFYLPSNRYSELENPPELPPYEAESVPPPSYEEVEETNRSSSDTTNLSSTDGRFSEILFDSPPPYTESK